MDAMKLPIIAICGRPNVGKSSLFNQLAGKKISIVDPTSGVTRDRVTAVASFGNHYCELVDTGGIGIVDELRLDEEIEHQIQIALRQADLILFLVDVKEGVMPLDIHVAELLRKFKNLERIWLLANKTDYYQLEMEGEAFRKLGFGLPIFVSAQERYGLETLQAKITEFLQPFPIVVPDEVQLKIAVVGKPNCGKSTFINVLAQEERMIVSEIPGTTRDSVDVYFEKDGQLLIAIDTAGIKRSKNLGDNIQYYSQHRSQRSIRRADVVIFMIDATQKIDRVDKEIANYIVEENKIVIIVINKWDLVPDIPTSKYQGYIDSLLPNLYFAPISFITAKDGKNVQSTLDLAKNLFKQSQRRVSTGEVNRAIKQSYAKKAPPLIMGKQGKIYYATQTDVFPPTFVLFVNDPKLFTHKYELYLIGQLRSLLNFPEVPLRLFFKERKRAEFEKLGISKEEREAEMAALEQESNQFRRQAPQSGAIEQDDFVSESEADLDDDSDTDETALDEREN